MNYVYAMLQVHGVRGEEVFYIFEFKYRKLSKMLWKKYTKASFMGLMGRILDV